MSEFKERNSVSTKNETDIEYHWSREDKIRYMIEVMQAYLDGERVVYRGTPGDFGGVLHFGCWIPCADSFPQYEIIPEEPKEPKKKKAVWEVMHKYGPMAGGFISLEAATMFLRLCGNHKTVERISRVEWDGGPVLSKEGDIIENPYDLLEDF